MTGAQTFIGKYMFVRELGPRDGTTTNRWVVCSGRTGDKLGNVLWYSPWRQDCFDPVNMTTFNSECLHEIATFLIQQNNARRTTLTKRKACR